METKAEEKVRLHESYVLFGIDYLEATKLFKDNVQPHRDVKVLFSEDEGELKVDIFASENRYLNRVRKSFFQHFEPYIMGSTNQEMEEIFFEMVSKNHFMVSTAESVTGGLIASRIINQPGSSAILKEGYVVYANDAKKKILNIDMNVLKAHGVVSIEVAEMMASKLLEKTHADICIVTTGIAGPTGGTDKVPVGTVCFGFMIAGAMGSVQKWFSGGRMAIRKKASAYALLYVVDYLRKQEKI